MIKHIENLYTIASKPKRLIIGLMSGTSLDGLDVALCSIENAGPDTKIKLLEFKCCTYYDNTKNKIRKVFANPAGRVEDVCYLNRWVAELHSEFILQAIKEWNYNSADIDIIASHGQTIFHSPGNDNSYSTTLQIGDGDIIAERTGIITVSDFRQKHIAGGGEGAPLAVYGDIILTSSLREDIILVNIGGIANITFIPATKKNIICTDTGPGNCLMNEYIASQTGKEFDRNGEIAAKGSVNTQLLESLLDHLFFQKKSPKTCGPETFNREYIEHAIIKTGQVLIAEDIMATLNYFTATSIADEIKKHSAGCKVIVSGGGVHNAVLLNNLGTCLPGYEITTELPVQINGDAKEAVIFALLANETVAGKNEIFKNAGLSPAVSFGKISFPG